MEYVFDTPQKEQLIISMPASLIYLPLAVSFAEKGAIALGLGKRESMAMTLAMEEIYSYLCKITSDAPLMEIRYSGREYYAALEIIFPAAVLNIKMFNITAAISFDNESSMDEMGLLIASRFVERLMINYTEGGKFNLTLIKEKAYPESSVETLPKTIPLDRHKIRDPDCEELKLLSRLIQVYYKDRYFPEYLMHPGKLVDMVKGGTYSAAIATDSAGHIGAGIIWHWSGHKTVDCAGPYVFNQRPESSIPADLVTECLNRISKTNVIGLINRYPTDDLPEEFFEILGTMDVHAKQGNALKVTAYHRQMNEDPGSYVWVHPEIDEYLRSEYDRLFLPREIRPAKNEGEAANPFSVLTVDFNRSQGIVTLHPVQSGQDIFENLSNHMEMLGRESFKNIFFEMDLGIPWHADFTPALISEKFIPRLILPCAGKGDIAVFQREASPV